MATGLRLFMTYRDLYCFELMSVQIREFFVLASPLSNRGFLWLRQMVAGSCRSLDVFSHRFLCRLISLNPFCGSARDLKRAH